MSEDTKRPRRRGPRDTRASLCCVSQVMVKMNLCDVCITYREGDAAEGEVHTPVRTEMREARRVRNKRTGRRIGAHGGGGSPVTRRQGRSSRPWAGGCRL